MRLIALITTLFFGWTLHAADKPNVVYILVDDLGYGDLGCFGQQLLTTPKIDQMAVEGMKFTRHYAGSTVCQPSRCVLMTGLHTGHCKVRGNGEGLIGDDDLTVPKLLKEAGYHTACIGKYGLGKPAPDDDPARKGFDHFFGYVSTSHAHNFYPTWMIRNGKKVEFDNGMIPGSGKGGGDTGVAPADHRRVWAPQLFSDDVQTYLDERAKQPEQPFFLYYALNIPHTNNEAGKNSPLGHGMEVPDYGEFKDRDWPDAEKGFAQFIRFMDDEVGRILEKLKTLGLAENTLVMFASDNGAHQEGGHQADFFRSSGDLNGIKRSLTDGGIRVPLIAWWPERVKAGSVSLHLSGFQDLLPTVAELTGVPLTAPTDGISFLPTLTGRDAAQKKHDHLVWFFNEQGGKQAILQWPWKLIHLNTLASTDEDESKRRPLEKQLFNLETDPSEEVNLAKSQPEKVAEMEDLLEKEWVELE